MPVYTRVFEAFQITEELRSDRRTWPAWLVTLLDVEIRDDVGSLFATDIDESDGKLTLRETTGDVHQMNWGDWVVYDGQSFKFCSAAEFTEWFRDVV